MNKGMPADEKIFRRLSYLLVFLMMASGVLAITGLIRTASPTSHAGIMAAVLLFVVIDRMYTHPQLKSLAPLSQEWAVAIGAQWIAIVVVLRLLLSYAGGSDAFLEDMSRVARGDLLGLLTVEYVFSLLFALLVWFLTGYFLRLLDEIGLDETLALSDAPPIVPRDTVPARQRLINAFFNLGIALVVLTGLARINLRNMASTISSLRDIEINRFSGGEAGTLLYFAFGLALLSLGRLLSLQTHWKKERIPVSSHHLTRQWGVYSVLFLLLLAVIVSLLPAGDSLGLFSLLGMLLSFLFSVLFFIGQLLLVLLSMIVSLPFMLLRGESGPVTREPPPLPVLPPPVPGTPAAPNEAWMLIRSILLWGGLAVIVVFAFVQFVRQHGGLRAALRQSRVTNWLILAWQWLYRSAGKTGATLSRAVSGAWQGLVSRLEGRRALPGVSFMNPRALDPRRRIYFFYLSMIRRSGEQGLARRASQTPSEYAAELEKALPSAAEDIDSITGAFVQARYSRQEVNPQRADLVKATWGRIRRALQNRLKPHDS